MPVGTHSEDFTVHEGCAPPCQTHGCGAPSVRSCRCPRGTKCSGVRHGAAMCFFLATRVRRRQRCPRTSRRYRADPPATSQTRASVGIPLCLGSVLVQIIVTSVFLIFIFIWNSQKKKKRTKPKGILFSFFQVKILGICPLNMYSPECREHEGLYLQEGGTSQTPLLISRMDPQRPSPLQLPRLCTSSLEILAHTHKQA